MKKFQDKSLIQLFEEFEENGYVEHICYDCGDECSPSEVDANQAFCDNCQEYKEYLPAI